MTESYKKTFELILMDLYQVLQDPGCPICRVARQSATSYIRYLMWESTHSFEERRRKLEPLSYCPQHVRQITALEFSQFGNMKSTNLMYEYLAGVIETRLATWQYPPVVRGLWDRLRCFTSKWFPHTQPAAFLMARSPCPICEDADKSARYFLDALVEESVAEFNLLRLELFF